jgi:hydrogenase expression/formation protein HypC
MCLAIPGRIKSIEAFKEGYMRMGKVELGGIVKEINLQLVPDAKENDYVLVHVGVAISIVDEEEAKRSLEFLKQMNELDELYNSPEEKPIDKLGMTKEERIKQGDVIISKMIP